MPILEQKSPVEGVVKTLVFEVVIKQVLSRVFNAVPILQIPLLNSLVTWIIGKVGELIYDEMSQFVSFTVIDIQVNSQVSDYKKSLETLKQATLESESVTNDPDKEQKLNEAKEDYKKRLAALISLKR